MSKVYSPTLSLGFKGEVRIGLPPFPYFSPRKALVALFFVDFELPRVLAGVFYILYLNRRGKWPLPL